MNRAGFWVMDKKTITIVSGLPRSGTSLMMGMLQAGDMPTLTDQIRKADDDNPKGYFELEKVKKLKDDQSWLKDACGKAVKIIFAFLEFLPAAYNYKIIFIERELAEILASQKKMLARRGKSHNPKDDEQLRKLYPKQLKKTKAWLAKQPNIEVLHVSYNEVLKNPAPETKRINQFLDNILDNEKMLAVIDPSLYRQRAQN